MYVGSDPMATASSWENTLKHAASSTLSAAAPRRMHELWNFAANLTEKGFCPFSISRPTNERQSLCCKARLRAGTIGKSSRRAHLRNGSS